MIFLADLTPLTWIQDRAGVVGKANLLLLIFFFFSFQQPALPKSLWGAIYVLKKLARWVQRGFVWVQTYRKAAWAASHTRKLYFAIQEH